MCRWKFSPFHYSVDLIVELGFDVLDFNWFVNLQVRGKLVSGGGVDAGQYGPNCTHVIVDKIVHVSLLSFTFRLCVSGYVLHSCLLPKSSNNYPIVPFLSYLCERTLDYALIIVLCFNRTIHCVWLLGMMARQLLMACGSTIVMILECKQIQPPWVFYPHVFFSCMGFIWPWQCERDE